jgi:geranylgeranyl diphosphate synthase, type II
MPNTRYAQRYTAMRHMVDRSLASLAKRGEPVDLRDACRYVLTGGGKRVRSALVLLSCEAVGGNIRDAVAAGAAVEIMHNFTLVHDDIMDNAPRRRGKPTVHVKWSMNTALLVGDVLLALAYASLLKTRKGNIGALVDIFTRGVIEVCEGQALDLAFEHRPSVTVSDYFRMIERKTGRLITTSTHVGGLIGGGTPAQIAALRRFGHYLGRAFQIQDDLLDVVAVEQEFGKAIGGDIVEGKKTFLLLRTRERASPADRRMIDDTIRRAKHRRVPLSPRARRQVVDGMTALYRKHGVLEEARHEVEKNTRNALRSLHALPPTGARSMLEWLANRLVHRSS